MRRLIALLLVAILVLSMATVVFANTEETTKNPSPEGSTETTPDKPKDPDSPSTGDSILWIVPMIVLGLFGVVVATKKLIKNH